MANYEYKKLVRRHWYSRFLFRRRLLVFFVIIVGVLAAFILFNPGAPDDSTKPTTSIQNIQVNDVQNTFQNDLFRFKDNGKWVLNKQESSAGKYIYYKFHGSDIQGQLIAYANQIPIPLDLEVPRVLPVRIVNDNSFEATSVSGPCGGSYAVGELHKVKMLYINGTNILCDPDNSQYKVVFGEVNGNYVLPLKRSNGQSVKLVITYRDMRTQPLTDSLMNIADSFQVL